MNIKSIDKLKIIPEIDQYIISQTKKTKKTTNYRIQCDISFVLSLISEGLNFYNIERFLAKSNILICSEKKFSEILNKTSIFLIEYANRVCRVNYLEMAENAIFWFNSSWVASRFISNHQTAALDEIIMQMTKDYDAPQITKSTLSKYLCFSLITLKKGEYHPITRYSLQTKQQRIDYGGFFIQNTNKHLIFLDEVGYTIAIQRNRGQSPKGQHVIKKLPLHQTANTTGCMTIDDTEILHFEKKRIIF